MRRRTGVLTSPPWTRAPLLLLSTPGVAVALVAATAVLGVAAASGPLFLSSAGSATFTRGATDGCLEETRPSIVNPVPADQALFGDQFSAQSGPDLERAAVFVPAAMQEQGLPTPYQVLIHEASLRPGTDRVNATVTLYSRSGALDHVEILSGDAGNAGVWLPDRYAGLRGLGPGDLLLLAFGDVPVAGVYRDLAGDGYRTRDQLDPFWCHWSDLILPTLERRPPPFLLADPQTLYALTPAVPELGDTAPEITGTWYAPVDLAALSLGEAEELRRRTEPLLAAVGSQAAEMGTGAAGYQRLDDLDAVVRQAQATELSLRGPVVPIALAASVISLLLVVAAGGLWVAQRRREVDLLVARGVGGVPIGVKAVLEVVPAVAIGGGLGWLGAAGSIRLSGPSSLIDPGALGAAGRTVAVASAAALLALGVVAAVASARRTDGVPQARWPRWLPWELAFLAVAWWSYARAAAEGGASEYGETIGLNPLLVAFPLFVLLGSLLLLARGLTVVVRLARRSSGAGARPAGSPCAV